VNLLDFRYAAKELGRTPHLRADVPALRNVVGRGELVTYVVRAAARGKALLVEPATVVQSLIIFRLLSLEW
jgi:hypothetical protein